MRRQRQARKLIAVVSLVLCLAPVGISSAQFGREFPLVSSALAGGPPQQGARADESRGRSGDPSDNQDRVPAPRPPFGTFANQDIPDQMQAWLSASMRYGLISLLSVLVAGVVGFVFARRGGDE